MPSEEPDEEAEVIFEGKPKSPDPFSSHLPSEPTKDLESERTDGSADLQTKESSEDQPEFFDGKTSSKLSAKVCKEDFIHLKVKYSLFTTLRWDVTSRSLCFTPR